MRGKQMQGFPARDQALADFFAAWEPVEEVELVPLEQAGGRITARALYSVNTLPVCRVSACDGIAVDSALFANGAPDYAAWREGYEFARADTGDDFDDRYDGVIPIEELDFAPGGGLSFISPDISVGPGSDVRLRGSVLKEGELLVAENLPLRPTDLAALAAGGIAMAPVRKRPRVAFIPTGSELVPVGVRPKRGENVDTNSVLVRQTLLNLGAEPIVFPIVPDEPERLKARLHEALDVADFVIINAGTAKGSEDFNFHMLANEGKLIHHYIAAAPGRPLAMAVIGGKPVVNLPGPTAAAFFNMDWCVRAVVARMLHIPTKKRQRITGVLMGPLRATPGMAVFSRLNAIKTPDGSYELYPLSSHSASVAQCMTSNAMCVTDIGTPARKKGDVIEAELLRGEEYLERPR